MRSEGNTADDSLLVQIASLKKNLERSESGRKKLEFEMILLLDAAHAEEDAKTEAQRKLEEIKAELAIVMARVAALEVEKSLESSNRPELSIGSSLNSSDAGVKTNQNTPKPEEGTLSKAELQARLTAVSSAHTLVSSQVATLQASLGQARSLLEGRTDLCARLETLLIGSVSEAARMRDRLVEAEKAYEELKAKAHAAKISSSYNQELMEVERMQKENLEALIASSSAESDTIRAQITVDRRRRLEELERPATRQIVLRH